MAAHFRVLQSNIYKQSGEARYSICLRVDNFGKYYFLPNTFSSIYDPEGALSDNGVFTFMHTSIPLIANASTGWTKLSSTTYGNPPELVVIRTTDCTANGWTAKGWSNPDSAFETFKTELATAITPTLPNVNIVIFKVHRVSNSVYSYYVYFYEGTEPNED